MLLHNKPSQTWWGNSHFAVLTNSVGQNLDRAQQGWIVSVPRCRGWPWWLGARITCLDSCAVLIGRRCSPGTVSTVPPCGFSTWYALLSTFTGAPVRGVRRASVPRDRAFYKLVWEVTCAVLYWLKQPQARPDSGRGGINSTSAWEERQRTGAMF